MTEAFKGAKLAQSITIVQPNNRCTKWFRSGEQFLFYLRPAYDGGPWRSPACHRNARLDQAADDLRFLRALPQSAQGTRLSGTVALFEAHPLRLVRPLPDVRVRVTGPSLSFDLRSNSDGTFERYGLRPGNYHLVPELPSGLKVHFPMVAGGGWNLGADDSLKLMPKGGVSVDFLVIPDTSVSGRVTDPSGRPMKGVCVSAEPPGAARHDPARSGCTTADGFYRIKDMPRGRYRIVANQSGQPTATEPFPAIYQPGTPDRTRATIVDVQMEKHEGLDIRIPSLLPRIELSGRVQFRDAALAPKGRVVFEANGYSETADVRGDGTYNLTILAGKPGRLFGEIWPHALWSVCAEGNSMATTDPGTIRSGPVRIGGDASVTGLTITLPIQCPK